MDMLYPQGSVIVVIFVTMLSSFLDQGKFLYTCTSVLTYTKTRGMAVRRKCLYMYVLGCGHIEVDYSGIRCTFLRAREYLKSNIMIYLYRVI